MRSRPDPTFVETADMFQRDRALLEELRREHDPLAWIQWVGILNEKGEEIEFRDHLPLKQIYRDLHPNQSNRKGAQIGMTETVINKLLWYGDNHNVTVIYTMPTATHVNKFSKSRFSPVIKKNLYLRQRMKGSVDTSELKHIGDSWIHFGGAQKENQAISVPADILVHDEFDFSDLDVLDTYGKRTLASKLNWKWRFSTPTLPGYGIDAEFDSTDQRVWVVKCERCNEYQEIDFWRNIFKGKYGSYYFGCWKCQKRLRRRAGFWLAKYPDRATDAVFTEDGKLKKPATGHRGYFINPLSFTFVTAESKMQSFAAAEKSNKPSKKKNFHNYELGLPYSSAENNLSLDRILETMSTQWMHDGYNVLGCDQGDNKHVVVQHVSPSGFNPIIKFFVTEDWEIVKKTFWEFGCLVGVVDALPNKDSARKLVQSMKKRMWMSYYVEQHLDLQIRVEREGNAETEIYSRNKKETQALNVDRTESLDETIQAWIDGRSYLVWDRERINPDVEEFMAHLRGMKRDIRANTKGIERAIWVKVKPDHYLHACNLAMVAAKLKKPHGDINDLYVGGNMGQISTPSIIQQQGIYLPPPPSLVASTFKDF